MDDSPGSVAWSFSNIVAGGPDGGNGVLGWRDNVRHPETNPRATVDKVAQNWKKDAEGNYWVGYEIERPPKPEEIARGVMADGEWLELGDGQRWLVPTIRQAPRTIGLDDDGNVTFELKGGAKSLFAECAERLTVFVGKEAGAVDVSFADFFGTCVRVLRANYLVDRNFVAARGLFDTHNLFKVIATALDLDKLPQYAEKKTG